MMEKKLGLMVIFLVLAFMQQNITTGGEGGMLISKSKSNAAYCRKISLHGMSKDAWKRFNKKGFIIMM